MKALAPGVPGTPKGEPVRIGSSPMVHTPGIFRYFANMYRTDPHRALVLLAHSIPNVPAGALVQALDGRAILTTEGETLIIQRTDADPPPFPDEYEEDEGDGETEDYRYGHRS